MYRYFIAGSMALLPLLTASCATSGGNDMANAVYNTNRTVRNLEQNLTPTVTKLNQTVVDMGARVEASESETARLAQTLETNTAILQRLQQQVENLQQVTYRERGLTPPRTDMGPSVPGGAPGVQVRPIGEGNPEDALLGPAPLGPAVAPPAGVAPVAQPLGPPPPATDPGFPVAMAPGPGVPPPPSGVTAIPPALPAPVEVPPAPPTTEPAPPPSVEPTTPNEPGQDLYTKAGDAFFDGKYDQALSGFDTYMQQYPNTDKTPSAQFWKGESLLKLNRPQDAIQEFERLRSTYPTNSKVPYSMYEQAKAHLQLGQTDEATGLLRKLIDEWPMTRPAATARKELEQRGAQ